MRLNADEVLNAQRRLRKRLLDDGAIIRCSRARDLAAQLLIRLDDVSSCWRFGTDWLQEELDADRITAGPCDARLPIYSPRFESLHPGKRVKSLAGIRVRTAETAVAEILRSRRVVVLRDHAVKSVGLPQPGKSRIALKFGMAMVQKAQPKGMVCAHWIDGKGRRSDEMYSKFTMAVRDVLSPILSAAEDLAVDTLPQGRARCSAIVQHASCQSPSLTPAEWRVARLAATGMSYKEIARELNRSFSTVDHHLRSIREKFGVSSASKLAMALTMEFDHSDWPLVITAPAALSSVAPRVVRFADVATTGPKL